MTEPFKSQAEERQFIRDRCPDPRSPSWNCTSAAAKAWTPARWSKSRRSGSSSQSSASRKSEEAHHADDSVGSQSNERRQLIRSSICNLNLKCPTHSYRMLPLL